MAYLDDFGRAHVEERKGAKLWEKHLERMTTCLGNKEV